MSAVTPGYIEVPINGNWLTKPVILRVTIHGDDAYDTENFKPCLAQGRYSLYNRWHVIEAIRAFGLDVLDDYLPFAIESLNTIVYAVVPLTPDDIRALKSLYGTAQCSDAVYPPVAAFPVPELPRNRDDLLTFAQAAQDAYHDSPVSKAVALLGVNTRLAGVPATLWRIVDLRNHQLDLFASLFRFFFKARGNEPAPRYFIAKSWCPVELWPVERKCAPAPFRSPGGYEPFTRWEIVEMVNGFGFDVMDDVLPHMINNDYEAVHAMLPNDKLSTQVYRTYLLEHVHPCYGYEGSYIGVRVTDYVNTLDEFIEMLVRSSRNLIIVTAFSDKVTQVNANTSFGAALRHSILLRHNTLLRHGLYA